MNGEKHLVTTLGDRAYSEVGWMLAHEHIFANFAADDDHGIEASAVVGRMIAEVERAKAVGISVLVDATAVGAARRPDILAALSHATNFPILAATGLFKEPAKRDWAAAHADDALTAWMVSELDHGIGETGVRAGWIKLSVTDSGVQPHEARLLGAAAHASRATNAVVGCHTVGSARANDILDIFEAAGGDPARFIWIHTQTEPDIKAHLAFARRGAWIEYDVIDADAGQGPTDATYVNWILEVMNAGLSEQLLLSHDRVGYDPAQQGGGVFKPYSTLADTFIPQLFERGIDTAAIETLLRGNPFRAYAR